MERSIHLQCVLDSFWGQVISFGLIDLYMSSQEKNHNTLLHAYIFKNGGIDPYKTTLCFSLLSNGTLVKNKTFVLLLEPVDGFFFGDLLEVSDSSGLSLSLGNSFTRSGEDNVEVHTEDTGIRVVSHTKIDVFLNTETEVTGVGEVSLSKFEFLNSETLFEDGFSDFTSDGNTASDLFESLNTERSDGESGLRKDGLLLGQIFQDLGSLGELITSFTDGDVQDELGNVDFSHGVISLGLGLGLRSLGGSSLAHFATF
jgi:hypothetical protein